MICLLTHDVLHCCSESNVCDMQLMPHPQLHKCLSGCLGPDTSIVLQPLKRITKGVQDDTAATGKCAQTYVGRQNLEISAHFSAELCRLQEKRVLASPDEMKRERSQPVSFSKLLKVLPCWGCWSFILITLYREWSYGFNTQNDHKISPKS